MKLRTMLYKVPGSHQAKETTFDYIIVDKCDEKAYDAALADGWCETMPQAMGILAPKEKKDEQKDEKESSEKEKKKQVPESNEEPKTDSEEGKAKNAIEKGRQRRSGRG